MLGPVPAQAARRSDAHRRATHRGTLFEVTGKPSPTFIIKWRIGHWTPDRRNMTKSFQKPKRLICDLETLSSTYGHFFAQPFERGFGTTIGNALRRVLLSSIEGAAISAVKIEGVLRS